MSDTIFEAENDTHRIVVTCEPEDDWSFADLEPEVKIERVSSEVYYVKATVWEKCGSCATWHHVIGWIVGDVDSGLWQEVAHNALHVAGLPLDTFNLNT